MNNYYALFQFIGRSILVRYISPECIRWDIEDAISSFFESELAYAEEDRGIMDYDEFVKTIMDSFNVEYEIINFDNYFVED